MQLGLGFGIGLGRVRVWLRAMGMVGVRIRVRFRVRLRVRARLRLSVRVRVRTRVRVRVSVFLRVGGVKVKAKVKWGLKIIRASRKFRPLLNLNLFTQPIPSMSNSIIQIDNLSKSYSIFHEGRESYCEMKKCSGLKAGTIYF